MKYTEQVKAMREVSRDYRVAQSGIVLEVVRYEHESTDGLPIPSYVISRQGATSSTGSVVYVPPGIWGGLHARKSQGYEPAVMNTCAWLAERNLTVYVVDRRGARGYGDEYMKQVDLFGLEVNDILLGVEYALMGGHMPRPCVLFGYCSGGSIGTYLLEAQGLFTCAFIISAYFDIQETFSRKSGYDTWDRFLEETHGELMRPDYPYELKSPIHRASKADSRCDIHLFHGRNDTIVPFSQSCAMYEALKGAGKQVSLHLADDFPHDREYADPSQPRNEWLWQVINGVLSDHGLLEPDNKHQSDASYLPVARQ